MHCHFNIPAFTVVPIDAMYYCQINSYNNWRFSAIDNISLNQINVYLSITRHYIQVLLLAESVIPSNELSSAIICVFSLYIHAIYP